MFVACGADTPVCDHCCKLRNHCSPENCILDRYLCRIILQDFERSKMAGLEEKLKDLLFRLNDATDIDASAVISMDGLMLASALPPDTNDDDVAAIAATLLGLGERTVGEFRQGRLRQVYVKGDNGFTIITNTGQDNVLIVATNEHAKLGVVFLHIKVAAREIEEAFAHLLDTPEQFSAFPQMPEP